MFIATIKLFLLGAAVGIAGWLAFWFMVFAVFSPR
jgi:hypothetical protein